MLKYVGVLGIVLVLGAAITIALKQNSSESTMDMTQQQSTPMATTSAPFTLESSAFAPNASIPKKYTCQGESINPPLSWKDAPAGTQSFALIVDDPDVPKQLKPDGVFDHWTLFNIPATTTLIAENSFAGVRGANGAGKNQYTGPCPPKQYEPSEHRYFFRLYALDTMLDVKEGATKAEVLEAIQGHELGRAELIGKYKQE